ncbi:4'-phosphopantetheinyl transferase Sfp [Abditibacteriota bacterium]|nr:4'-phosphopantetheinyl transferase Sfp [Abditibacteriota bacterium]
MLAPELLNDGSVHIWMADLNRLQARQHELESHLDHAERKRAGQFHFATDRTRFIIGRGHLREILSSCLGVPPSRLIIAYNSNGKPFLPDYPQWHFNVSHSQHRALFAVSYGREVGIDIELLRPEISLPLLAPSALCDAERQQLNRAENTVATFLQLWTLKEAFLKAKGLGLSFPLTQIDVSYPNGQISLQDSKTRQWSTTEEWRAIPLNTCPDCLAAIAALGQNWRIIRHES